MNPRNLFAVLAAGSLLSSYLAWDWYLSPQAQVERQLKRAARAAEEKDFEELFSCLSTDYTGFHNMDYESTSEQIQEGFEQVDRLNVTLRRVLPEVDGSEATASFDATVVAIRGEQRFVILGTVTQPERLRAHLRLEDGEWKIHRVELSGDAERRE
ncbi:MAG: nuclear transport factor 2 family protein [Vicinamibacteria bacterium]